MTGLRSASIVLHQRLRVRHRAGIFYGIICRVPDVNAPQTVDHPNPAERDAPDANTRYTGKLTVIVALIGVCASLLTWWLTKEFDGADDEPEPRITISSAEWRDDAKDPGMYRAKGHADLQKGQVVYLFNAQVQKDETTGPLFPDLGPCPTNASGDWECDAAFAGAPEDRGVRFRIFAMVLDDENAYETVKKREGFYGENQDIQIQPVPPTFRASRQSQTWT
jgi:hypothetical protein